MPYRYLEDVATADVAFEATADSLEALFISAADAVIGAMAENPTFPPECEHIGFQLESEDLEMLLFDFLQELIFYKDARRLLLKVINVEIDRKEAPLHLSAATRAIPLNSESLHLLTDVKAVTMHRFAIERTGHGWKATVILDV
jgi:SHS2 domain-containing protein